MKLFCVPLALVFAVAAQTPSFEVASVKPNRSGSFSSSSRLSAGQVRMENVTLKKAVLIAYGIPDDRDYALVGPSWLESERFDILAKAAAGAAPDQLRKMLQGLLAERFHLVLHPETRQLQTYVLIVAKDGPKVRAVDAGPSSTNGRSGRLEATKITMDKLANLLSRLTGQPVVNATDLPGVFTFTLEWTPDETQRLGRAEDSAPPPAAGTSLFSAVQEQLGLKLEGRKAPAEVLVVDRVDRTPTEN